jgi:hypothetical protein
MLDWRCYMTWIIQCLRLALSKGSNRVGVSLPSPEAGKMFNFPIVVFSGYLEFGIIDKAHKPSDSDCCIVHYRQGTLNSTLHSWGLWRRCKNSSEDVVKLMATGTMTFIYKQYKVFFRHHVQTLYGRPTPSSRDVESFCYLIRNLLRKQLTNKSSRQPSLLLEYHISKKKKK